MMYSRTFTAVGAIPKFRIVKFDSSDSTVTLATSATDRLLGVYIGPEDASNGDDVEICILGECFLDVFGTVNRGQSFTTNASGQGIAAAPTTGANVRIGGIGMTTGTSTTIWCFVSPGAWMQG